MDSGQLNNGEGRPSRKNDDDNHLVSLFNDHAASRIFFLPFFTSSRRLNFSCCSSLRVGKRQETSCAISYLELITMLSPRFGTASSRLFRDEEAPKSARGETVGANYLADRLYCPIVT